MSKKLSWRVTSGGEVQVDSRLFSWRCWEDSEAMNGNEKVQRRNLFRMESEKFSLGHTERLWL